MGRGGEVVGLNPNIRIYRYTKGQFFDVHCKLRSSIFISSYLVNIKRVGVENLVFL